MITDECYPIDSSIILIVISSFIFLTIGFFITKGRYKDLPNIKALKTKFKVFIFIVIVTLILPIIQASPDMYCFLYFMLTPGIYFLLLNAFYILHVIKQRKQEESQQE